MLHINYSISIVRPTGSGGWLFKTVMAMKWGFKKNLMKERLSHSVRPKGYQLHPV